MIKGYFSIHNWVRKNKPKPLYCEDCKIKPPRELANISGKYERDIKDYKWLCSSCHKKFDKIDERNLSKGIKWAKNRKGKNNKEIFGEKKAKEISRKISKNKTGKRFSEEARLKVRQARAKQDFSYLVERNRSQKGKTYEELYGKNKAREMKNKRKLYLKNIKRNSKGQFKNGI